MYESYGSAYCGEEHSSGATWLESPDSLSKQAKKAMIGSFLVDSDDLAETEHLVSAHYAKVRIGACRPGTPTRARVWRTNVGQLSVDESEFSYDMGFDMEPPEKVLLCRVRSGVIDQRSSSGEAATLGAGQVVAFGAQHDVDYVGEVRHALYDVITIEHGLLDEAAGFEGASVRFTGSVPVDAAANQLVVDAIDHVRHGVMANPHAAAQPLIASAVSRYLAAMVVAALPNVAASRPVIPAGMDNSPALLRRAIAYIDDNAHTDIAVTDIASAVGLTPYSLLRLFRQHRDCAPMQYVRRVRLHHARVDLESGLDDAVTVSEVAHRWGFGNVGRFAMEYQQTYGRRPVGARPDASVTSER